NRRRRPEESCSGSWRGSKTRGSSQYKQYSTIVAPKYFIVPGRKYREMNDFPPLDPRRRSPLGQCVHDACKQEGFATRARRALTLTARQFVYRYWILVGAWESLGPVAPT